MCHSVLARARSIDLGRLLVAAILLTLVHSPIDSTAAAQLEGLRYTASSAFSSFQSNGGPEDVRFELEVDYAYVGNGNIEILEVRQWMANPSRIGVKYFWWRVQYNGISWDQGSNFHPGSRLLNCKEMIYGQVHSVTFTEAWIVPQGGNFQSVVNNHVAFGGVIEPEDDDLKIGDCYGGNGESYQSANIVLTAPNLQFGPSLGPPDPPADTSVPGAQAESIAPCLPNPVVSQSLAVEPEWTRPDEVVRVSMTITNTGCATFQPELLGVGGRGPGEVIEDVGFLKNATIPPGESLIITGSRAFTTVGDRQLLATYRADGTSWYDIPATGDARAMTVVHVAALGNADDSTRLGGFDLDRACRATYGDSQAVAVQLDARSPYSWRCLIHGEYYSIDLVAAAQEQYGENAYPVYEESHWSAYAAAGESAPVASASEAEAPEGAERLGPFDLNGGCQWYHNDSEAYAAQLDVSDPYSWRCVAGGMEYPIDLDAVAVHQYGDGAFAVLEGSAWAAYRVDSAEVPIAPSDVAPTDQQGTGSGTTDLPNNAAAQPQLPPESPAPTPTPIPPAVPTPTPAPPPTPTPIPHPDSVYYGPFDLNAGCQWYHDDSGASATQLVSGDPYSWRCVSGGVEHHIDLDAIAKYHYGPNACAYLGNDGYWFAASC